MVDQSALMPSDVFAAYRRLRDRSDYPAYCEPFVPVVGKNYGRDGASSRILLCGVAPYYDAADSYSADDQMARTEAFERWESFLRSDASGYGSAFWRLAVRVLNDFGPNCAPGESPLEALAWTNLSKLNSVKATAPEADAALHVLNIEQILREFRVLEPEIAICVSGSSLVAIGEAAFSAFIELPFVSRNSGTKVYMLPNGGHLYWSMHPARKPAAWADNLMADLHEVFGRAP